MCNNTLVSLSCDFVVDNGRTKPHPRPSKKTKGGASSEPDENLCLLRVTNGKKKISTVVSGCG